MMFLSVTVTILNEKNNFWLYQVLWHDNKSWNITASKTTNTNELSPWYQYQMDSESISISFQTCKFIIRGSRIKQKCSNTTITTCYLATTLTSHDMKPHVNVHTGIGLYNCYICPVILKKTKRIWNDILELKVLVYTPI